MVMLTRLAQCAALLLALGIGPATAQQSADPRLADERFVGWFRTNDPEGFAEAAATTFNGSVGLGHDTIVLRGG